MKKVLIVYFSVGGATEAMARYIAEGVRIAGHEAEVRKVSEIGEEKDLAGYDGYIFGCPTYHLDVPGPVNTFLSVAAGAGLKGKAGGAFSASGHPGGTPGGAARLLFDRMESLFAMKMTDLGPFNLTQGLFDHPDGMRACHDYGRAVGEMLTSG
jgi:flavorubredoxin